jgi:hypothetical protein
MVKDRVRQAEEDRLSKSFRILLLYSIFVLKLIPLLFYLVKSSLVINKIIFKVIVF